MATRFTRQAGGATAGLLLVTIGLAAAVALVGCGVSRAAPAEPPAIAARALRLATYNLRDLRLNHLDPDHADFDAEQHGRARRLAATVARLDADILLLGEIAYDGESPSAAERFAGLVHEASGRGAPRYAVLTLPSNTGEHSGVDLDNNGVVDPAPGSRIYAGDCFGWGEFRGQYAMALFVRPPLTINVAGVRTYRRFLWRDMPNAALPADPRNGAGEPTGWYTPEELSAVRLSSKSHWHVPVRVPGLGVWHVLAAHPTPPVFDGPEDRNGRRNHDEIRLLASMIGGHGWLRTDAGGEPGVPTGEPFVVLGDLNADPTPGRGDSFGDPMAWLLDHPRIRRGETDPLPTPVRPPDEHLPAWDPARPGLEAWRARRPDQELPRDATATFGLRVDHVIPSARLNVLATGIGLSRLPELPRLDPQNPRNPRNPQNPQNPQNPRSAGNTQVPTPTGVPANEHRHREADPEPLTPESDHFPVWMDVATDVSVVGGPPDRMGE